MTNNTHCMMGAFEIEQRGKSRIIQIDEKKAGSALVVGVSAVRVRKRRALRHRSLIAGRVVKPSVQRLSGDECPCRVMVLCAVGVNRRMMVSEAPAS